MLWCSLVKQRPVTGAIGARSNQNPKSIRKVVHGIPRKTTHRLDANSAGCHLPVRVSHFTATKKVSGGKPEGKLSPDLWKCSANESAITGIGQVVRKCSLVYRDTNRRGGNLSNRNGKSRSYLRALPVVLLVSCDFFGYATVARRKSSVLPQYRFGPYLRNWTVFSTLRCRKYAVRLPAATDAFQVRFYGHRPIAQLLSLLLPISSTDMLESSLRAVSALLLMVRVGGCKAERSSESLSQ